MYHVKPDADGLYGGLIVPKLHANYLFYHSLIHIVCNIANYLLMLKETYRSFPFICDLHL